MAKKRERQQNREPFLKEDADSIASTKTRTKASKHHQKQQKMISSGMSSKILKEALIQQKEIQAEEAKERNPNFNDLEEELPEREEEQYAEDEIDDFSGFSETQSQFNDYPEEIDENDEKLLEAFLSKDAGPQQTLTDLIIEKIKKTDAHVSSETQPMPKLDQSLIDLYKGVGEYLSKYTAGKIPKAFKHIPSMQLWEDVLYLTEPQKWSPSAMYQATRIFSSNLGAKKAERFYRLVLLPRGILLPLCKSRTCNLREAVIVGSVIQKVSIPMLHSCVTLLKLAEMDYCGTTSYFIKLLLDKKYALPYRVVDAVVGHFMRFLEDTRIMPVIWHQSLLSFVQRYKNELQKEDKDNLRRLVLRQKHKLVSPEIIRELDNSLNRGEKDDPMSINILCLQNLELYTSFIGSFACSLYLSFVMLCLYETGLIFRRYPWRRTECLPLMNINLYQYGSMQAPLEFSVSTCWTAS
ncbi:hypothetical protein OIU78_025123 [Salix suchowensis]|nr:hypothetical protein OIU78_025123 [Salix suchowensis]